MEFYLIDLERTIGQGIPNYWRQNRHGYTKDIESAGTFSKDIAEDIVKKDRDHTTVMVEIDDWKIYLNNKKDLFLKGG